MDEADSARLSSKRWLLHAKKIRESVRPVIAGAISRPPEDVNFTDEAETKHISDQFSARLVLHRETVWSTRGEAIAQVRSRLGGKTVAAFLLVRDFHACGAVEIEFSVAISCIDALMKSQYECFRVMSVDGSAGACVTAQEGSAAAYPHFVTLWGDGV